MLTRAVRLGGVLAVLMLMSGCGGDDSADGASMPIVDATATIDPAVLDPCSQINLTTVVPTQLTVATTERRFAPYLTRNDRDEWVGQEADLVYGIAKELGFPPVQVTWIEQPTTPADFLAVGDADFLIGQVTRAESASAGAEASAPYAANLEGEDVVLAFAPGNPLATCVAGALTELATNGQMTES